MSGNQILAGVILMAVGVVLCVIAYDMLQPDYVRMGLDLLEALANETDPSDALSQSKAPGYTLLGLGVAASVAGLVLILKRPTSDSNSDQN